MDDRWFKAFFIFIGLVIVSTIGYCIWFNIKYECVVSAQRWVPEHQVITNSCYLMDSNGNTMCVDNSYTEKAHWETYCATWKERK